MHKKRILSTLLFSALILSGCNKSPSVSSSILESSDDVTESSETVIDYPLVEFRATSPLDVPSNAAIKLAGNFNSWDPLAEGYTLKHLKDNIYTYTHAFSKEEIGFNISFKFVLIYDDHAPSAAWDNEEVTAEGTQVRNRVITLTAGKSRYDFKIGGFKSMSDVNTVTRGSLVKLTLEMPQFSDNRKRTIRVWLPDGYDENDKTKKYPVFYMHDGQNLFDRYTSYSGEWEIDESIGKMMDEGYGGTIVVGIDNGGTERLNEYSPNAFTIKSENNSYNIVGEGEKHAAFVVETLKPYIDANFNTLSDKTNTGIGGSSMGGIISFFTSLTYQDIFGYGLIFSSSFWLYDFVSVNAFLESKVTDHLTFPKLYLYHGEQEGSYAYLETLSNFFNDKGIPSNFFTTYIGKEREHNEPSWAKEFPRGYKWLMGL